MSMRKIWIIISIVIVLIISIVIGMIVINNNSEKNTLGVWWWSSSLDAELYLNFAKENGVNEVYYSSSEFGEQTKTFIQFANQKGIDVYYLQGEYQWLNDSGNLFEKMEKYKIFQEENPKCRFAGVHLDIEPHQNPEFGIKRVELIYKLVYLANQLKDSYPAITFDYDIPFWFDDEIEFNNITKPAYQHMIDIADRVFVMSYRDTALAIKDIAKEELEYAKSNGKKIVLSVETKSSEGDKVSFLEEGKTVMMAELKSLKEEFGDCIGLAIHHIKSWHDLKD